MDTHDTTGDIELDLTYELSHLVATTSKSFAKLLQLGSDAVALYMFYVYISKNQDNRKVWSTTGYTAKGLGWGKDKVIKVKKLLVTEGWIQDVVLKDNKGKVKTWLVEVKYRVNTNPPSGKTTLWILPRVDKSDTSTPIETINTPKESKFVANATVLPFESKEAVQNLLKDENRDIKIIGYMFQYKKMLFSSRKELSQAIAINRQMIKNFEKKHGMHPFEGIDSKKILKAMEYAKEKYPDWSLKVIMERCFEIGA